MKPDEAMRLAGLYRPRTEPPGFAIPVFRDSTGALAAQEATTGGLVAGFVPCLAAEAHLFIAPLQAARWDFASTTRGSELSWMSPPKPRPWTVAIGQSLLYAFQRMDGSFVVGPRADVAAAVREDLLNLRAQPFTWAEAARFVGDAEQLRRAEAATANLLRNPDRQKRVIAPFTAATSAPKHRASADALRLDEKAHVEEPLLAQLEALEWQVLRLPMHHQTPAHSGRRDLAEVVLRERLAASLKAINDCLEPDQIEEMVERLTNLSGPSLIENNRQVHAWLTEEGPRVAENRKTGELSPTVQIVDFSRPEKNDWLAVSQLKVRIPGREQYIAPDVILFLNGLPLVVFECKSPKVQEPLAEAIDQLLRYSEQRESSGEGVPALFYYNQFVVATCGQMAKFGTITTHTERHFYRWSDPWPFTLDEVAKQTHKEGAAGSPSDQARLTAGMCSPRNLLSLLQSFTIFSTDGRGRSHKVVARYQQFRAVHKTLERMTKGETPQQRGGIVWHTQGSGKSLTMIFVVRELRRRPALQDWKVIFVTDRTQLEEQLGETGSSIGQTVIGAENITHLKELLRDPSSNCVMAMVQKFQEHDLNEIFPVLNENPSVLVMIDEAHRTQYKKLGANLRRALPFATHVAYTGTPIDRTEETFGDYIDKYTMRQAQDDGVILEIVYEGRTHAATVSDAAAMDAKFQDVFSEYRLEERSQILGYGTRNAYLDAQPTIEAKARDMVRHYARHVFPGGYKAQVVANSRIAAVRYVQALREAIAAEAEALRVDNPLLISAESLRSVEVALVMTWGHNDELELQDAMRDVDAQKVVKRFKLPFDAEEADGDAKLNGRIGFVVVNEMLVTGFDAPLEQVLYLDRVIRDHGLLQAIARVNRVYDDGKDCGFVIDYVGVGNNLRRALDAYAAREQEEVIDCLTPVSEVLGELKQALEAGIALLAANGVSETTEPEAFYDLFYDEDLRFDYLTKFRTITSAFNKALPRPEALDFFGTYQRLAMINELASQFLKDDRLSMKGVPKKLRALTDEFLVSNGVEQRIAPISVLDPDFQRNAARRGRSKTKAAEVEHAIRHHIEVNYDDDPELSASIAAEIERILTEFAGNWDAIAEEMEKLRQKLIEKAQQETHGLDRKRQMPIFRILQAELFGSADLSEEQIGELVNLTQLLFLTMQTELRQAGFWDSSAAPKQNRLNGELKKILLGPDHYKLGPMMQKEAAIRARLMEWARVPRNTKLICRP